MNCAHLLYLFAQVKESLAQLPVQVIGKPLFTGVLSPKQWEILERIHADMKDEYRYRRVMLLKRLDVTIQSFQWSGTAKVVIFATF